MTVLVDFDSRRRLKQLEFSERSKISLNTPTCNEWIAVSYLGSTLNQCWAAFRSKGQEKFLFRGTSGKLPRASKRELG